MVAMLVGAALLVLAAIILFIYQEVAYCRKQRSVTVAEEAHRDVEPPAAPGDFYSLARQEAEARLDLGPR